MGRDAAPPPPAEITGGPTAVRSQTLTESPTADFAVLNGKSGTGKLKIIAIANPKGGSAKTTTTVNLAACLAETGRKVLVIDLDPQGSATAWLGAVNAANPSPGIFRDNAPVDSLVCDTTVEGVFVIPSATNLPEHEIDFALGEATLKSKLRSLKGWDYVLIDCPASLGPLTLNAMAASDEVIAPVEASVLGLTSLANVFRAANTVRERCAPQLGRPRILPCRVNTRTRHAEEVVEKLREKLAERVFTHVIRENVRLTECPGFMQPVTEYAPNSRGAQDYRDVANELIAAERN